MLKTRKLFNISTTNECRLWYWNMNEDSHCYITLSDLKKTVAGTFDIMKDENMYNIPEFILNMV